MSESPIPASRLVCVYAEALARGKRVLVIGESTGVGGWLMDLGARMVHVYDPVDEDSMQPTPPRGVTVYRLSQSDFDVRDGAFDLALIPDLGNVPDPAAIIARIRRIIGPDGALVVSARNPEGAAAERGGRAIDYYELYDLVALQFTSVRMVAQVPFSGAALAELGEADPDVTIHTDLAPDPPPPEYFIAVASQRDHRLDPYTIVQLPPARQVWPTSPAPAPSPEEWVDRAMLAEATLRAELLEAQLEEQTGSLRELQARAAEAFGLTERLSQEVPRAQGEAQRYAEQAARLDVALRIAQEAVAALEDRAATAEDRVRHLERDATEAQTGLRRGHEEREGLVHELQMMRAELTRAKEIDPEELARVVAHAVQYEARADALESELARTSEAYSEELARTSEAHSEELTRFETALRERAQVLAELERELRRREQMVHDLLAAMEDAGQASGAAPDAARVMTSSDSPASPPRQDVPALTDRIDVLAEENAVLRAKLDALALEVARREGELQSRTWRIEELEGELARAAARPSPPLPPPMPAPPPRPAGPDPGVAEAVMRAERAEEELDFLRRALAQEHEARVRSESNQELETARAELQRQAVLIEQLSGELDAKDRAAMAHAVREP